MFFLFAAGTSYAGCSFGGVNANSWVQINALLLVIAISLGGVFYAFSNILPPSQGEKMKGMVKAEIFQGVIGIVIIGILISSAIAWCNIGSYLTSSAGLGASNPMAFSESYLQNLLFTKGFSLFGSMYSETAVLMLDGILISHISALLERIEASFMPLNNLEITVTLSQGLAATIQRFALAFGVTNFAIFTIVSGIIFVIYLTLPVVSSIALTVVVPTAIAMRMVPFLGPKVREVSDTFLSIAIAAYFIFPLMIVMNSLLVSYLYTPCGATVSACNPYSSYLNSYPLNNLPVSSLFNTPPSSLGGVFSMPANFFAGITTGTGGMLGAIELLFKNIIMFPQVLVGFSQDVALFAFQGVFLIGLDVLVTVAFAQALTRGLNSVSAYVSGGGFWG